MAIKPGDRGHVAEHNTIDTRLDALEALPPGTSDSAVAGFIATTGVSATKTALLDGFVPVENLTITDGGDSAGAGGPDRPNVQIGGQINGTTIEPSQIHGVILQPGGPGFNNVIGGDGTLTVGTSTPNTADASVGNCGVSLVGGYDCVAGQISSKIISDHSYTAPGGAGHSAIYGGYGHVIRAAGDHAMIAGGQANDVSGPFSLTSGNTNKNAGSGSLVAGLFNTLALSSGSFVIGQLNDVETSYASARGYSNKVDSLALFGDVAGAFAEARSPFVSVRSGGKIAAQGDAQHLTAHYRGQSTSATAVLLSAAYTGTGSGSQYLMVQAQTVLLTARVVARTAGGDTVGVWILQGAAAWASGGAAPAWLSGSPTSTVVYTNGSAAAPSLLLGAGGSAGRVFVSCAGVASTTINWSAKFEAVEVIA